MVIPHSYDPAHSCICRKIAETSPVQKNQVQKQPKKGSLMPVHLDSGLKVPTKSINGQQQIVRKNQ